jgi:acyl-CoA synthetase (AMP-forming)/AMP-acid ligase II
VGARENGGVQGAAHREFVDELPRTATGKILWRKLQEEENRK